MTAHMIDVPEFRHADAPGWHRLWWREWPPFRWQWTCACGFFVRGTRRSICVEERDQHECLIPQS